MGRSWGGVGAELRRRSRPGREAHRDLHALDRDKGGAVCALRDDLLDATGCRQLAERKHHQPDTNDEERDDAILRMLFFLMLCCLLASVRSDLAS